MTSSINYSITEEAYAKIILHGAKYPHVQVNGVVLGTLGKNKVVSISDAVPLFHGNVLATMLEMAFLQVGNLGSPQNLRNREIRISPPTSLPRNRSLDPPTYEMSFFSYFH